MMKIKNFQHIENQRFSSMKKLSSLLVVMSFITLFALFLNLFSVKEILLAELIYAILMTLVVMVMFAKLKNGKPAIALAFLFYVTNLLNIILLYLFSSSYAVILLLVAAIGGFFLTIDSCGCRRCKVRSQKVLGKKEVKLETFSSEIKEKVEEPDIEIAEVATGLKTAEPRKSAVKRKKAKKKSAKKKKVKKKAKKK